MGHICSKGGIQMTSALEIVYFNTFSLRGVNKCRMQMKNICTNFVSPCAKKNLPDKKSIPARQPLDKY